MIETIQTPSAKVVGWRLNGRLHDEDYQQFLPQVESVLTAQGKVRLFVQFDDFRGWDIRAAWDELKFGASHYSDFERIAMVGDRTWEKWMAALCKPFTGAKVKYFDKSQVDEAWKWLLDEEVPEPADKINENLDAADECQAWRGIPWYGF